MGGVIGYWNYADDGLRLNAPSAANALAKMLDPLAHRLPAPRTTWSEAGLGLAAAEIAIATTTGGAPTVAFESPARRHVSIVAAGDVRLDNRVELAALLELAPAAATRPRSDIELVLAAYRHFGVDCARKLHGAFAIVIWDGPKERLIAFRDAMGQKPLYYTRLAGVGVLALASELKALLALEIVPRALDELRVVQYLNADHADHERTFYQSVRRVPPAHVLVLDHAGLRLTRYFRFDPERQVAPADDAEHAARFREHFVRATQGCLPTHGPVGFFLSGGLDSAMVLGAAREARVTQKFDGPDHEFRAFSARFPDFPHIDESALVERLLTPTSTPVDFVRADAQSPLADIDAIYTRLDEPFHAPNLYVQWLLCAAAQRAGLPVVLDGIDGDTVVCHGLELLEQLLCEGNLVACWRETRALARRVGTNPLRLFARFAARPAFQRFRAPRAIVSPIVRREVAARTGWIEHARARDARQKFTPATLRHRHCEELESGLFTLYLELLDQTAASFGIDQRHPFCDVRLVEFCLALPPEQRLVDGWDRVVQRRAAVTLVPPETAWRLRKSDWSDAFKRGFCRALPDHLRRLHATSATIEEFIDLRELAACEARVESGRFSDTDLMSLWVAITLGHWLERGRS
ncbi:MAG: asparagine synthase-related protein [Planctomycetota bacterium]